MNKKLYFLSLILSLVFNKNTLCMQQENIESSLEKGSLLLDIEKLDLLIDSKNLKQEHILQLTEIERLNSILINNLVSLKIEGFPLATQEFSDSLLYLINKCKKLKYLNISVRYNSKNFDFIRYFKNRLSEIKKIESSLGLIKNNPNEDSDLSYESVTIFDLN